MDWRWSSKTLVTGCEEVTNWKRPWFWERLKAGGEGDDRGRDGWMASPTQWRWVWVDFGSWWRTGRSACCGPWGCKKSDTTDQPNTHTHTHTIILSHVSMFSSVQSLSRVWLFATPWITARQASLSITNSRSSLKLMSIESMMPSDIKFYQIFF